jgi:hypothetical protein
MASSMVAASLPALSLSSWNIFLLERFIGAGGLDLLLQMGSAWDIANVSPSDDILLAMMALVKLLTLYTFLSDRHHELYFHRLHDLIIRFDAATPAENDENDNDDGSRGSEDN